jgi:hypothetical protein
MIKAWPKEHVNPRALIRCQRASPPDELEQTLRQLKQRLKSLLERWGQASRDEVREVLEARGVVQPEQELEGEVINEVRTADDVTPI